MREHADVVYIIYLSGDNAEKYPIYDLIMLRGDIT